MSISGTDSNCGKVTGKTGTLYEAEQREIISLDGVTWPPPADLFLADDKLGGGGGGGPGADGGGGGPDDTGVILTLTGGDGDSPLLDVGALTKFPRFKELLPPNAQTASLNL